MNPGPLSARLRSSISMLRFRDGHARLQRRCVPENVAYRRARRVARTYPRGPQPQDGKLARRLRSAFAIRASLAWWAWGGAQYPKSARDALRSGVRAGAGGEGLLRSGALLSRMRGGGK